MNPVVDETKGTDSLTPLSPAIDMEAKSLDEDETEQVISLEASDGQKFEISCRSAKLSRVIRAALETGTAHTKVVYSKLFQTSRLRP
jgi:hypothetical protein